METALSKIIEINASRTSVIPKRKIQRILQDNIFGKREYIIWSYHESYEIWSNRDFKWVSTSHNENSPYFDRNLFSTLTTFSVWCNRLKMRNLNRYLSKLWGCLAWSKHKLNTKMSAPHPLFSTHHPSTHNHKWLN